MSYVWLYIYVYVCSGVFAYQHARDFYRDWCNRTGTPMNYHLLEKYLITSTIIISPFCPFYAEHIWELIGQPGSIIRAHWPEVPAVNKTVLRIKSFIKDNLSLFRVNVQKAKVNTSCYLYVADQYAEWKLAVLRFMQVCSRCRHYLFCVCVCYTDIDFHFWLMACFFS